MTPIYISNDYTAYGYDGPVADFFDLGFDELPHYTLNVRMIGNLIYAIKTLHKESG